MPSVGDLLLTIKNTTLETMVTSEQLIGVLSDEYVRLLSYCYRPTNFTAEATHRSP